MKIRSRLGVLVIVSMLCLLFAPLKAVAADQPRPVLSAGTIKTPSGKLIRAGVGWFSSWSGDDNQMARLKNQAYYQQLKDYGNNAIRITNWDMRRIAEGHITSNNYAQLAQNLVPHLDEIVNLASQNDMYLIITNSNPGTYNKAYLDAFWNQFAGRYKDRTHVIYEVCNEPAAWSASAYTNAVLDDLAAVYANMRTKAPNTPMLHLTFSHPTESMISKVASYTTKTGISWTDGKNFVAFHPYGKTSGSATPAYLSSQYMVELKNNYPVMMTEAGFVGQPVTFPILHNGTYYEEQALFFEMMGISWLYFGSTSQFRYDDLIDTAKSMGLYWQSDYRKRINDPLNGWTNVHAKSANMTLATGNASQYFNGDASRATRTNTATGFVTYQADDVYSFEAKIYTNGGNDGIKFYSSADNVNWTQLTVGNTALTATADGWSWAIYKPTNAIPAGQKYVKVEFSSTRANYVTQLSEISVWNRYDGWPNREADALDSFAKTHSRTSNMTIATANSANFEGDVGRAARTNTSPGSVVYKVDDTVLFRAKIFYNSQADGITFSASPNGTNWTTIPTTSTTPVAIQNGWYSASYTPTGDLPFGTNYIRVQFSSTRGNHVTQLGDIILTHTMKN